MTLLKVNNRPLKTWNGLVNELFADFDQAFGRPVTAPANLPQVNIGETTEAFHLELAAPGRQKENFFLDVQDLTLILGYKQPEAPENKEFKLLRKEFDIADFKRVFNLGEQIDTEGIQAKYEDGLLKVYLPKKPENKPISRQINIQ